MFIFFILNCHTGSYFYTKFKRRNEEVAKIFSPEITIDKTVKKICFDYFLRKTDENDKIEVSTFNNGNLEETFVSSSKNNQTDIWIKNEILFKSRFDTVKL